MDLEELIEIILSLTILGLLLATFVGIFGAMWEWWAWGIWIGKLFISAVLALLVAWLYIELFK